MKNVNLFLTLLIILPLFFLGCSNETENDNQLEGFEEKAAPIFQIHEEYENPRLKGNIKRLKISSLSLNPLALESKGNEASKKYLTKTTTLKFDSLGRLTSRLYYKYKYNKPTPRLSTFAQYTDSIKVKDYFKYHSTNIRELEIVIQNVNNELYKQHIFLYNDTLIKKRYQIDKEGIIESEITFEYDKNDNLLWIVKRGDDGKFAINKFTVKDNESVWVRDFEIRNQFFAGWIRPSEEYFGNFFKKKRTKNINSNENKEESQTITYQDWGDFNIIEVNEKSDQLDTILKEVKALKKQEEIRIIDNHGNCIEKLIFLKGRLIDRYQRDILYY